MNCLVVGYGSIGRRHVEILDKLNCRVAVVTEREIDFSLKYNSLYKAIIEENPSYIVIANQTNRHYNSLTQLIEYGFKGNLLIEKPLFNTMQKIPVNSFNQAYVGYNLRFHPILQKLFKIIKNENVLYTQVYVGQYLPIWRKDQDYRISYSAKKAEGGGVLLDLSHELDYLLWLYDDWSSMVSVGGKYSSLQIDSDDIYSIMLVMKKCPMVQVNLNYLDRISRREITIITENYSIKADLVQQTLQVNQELQKYNIDRNYTYHKQHESIMNKDSKYLCTLANGFKVLDMVNFAEQSATEREWVHK